MATAFAATDGLEIGNIGPKLLMRTYSLQLPSAWTAAGQAWDLSDDFDVVTGYSFGPSAAVDDFTWGKLDFIGTAVTGGFTASTIKIVAMQTGNGNGVVFTSAADSEDFSTVTAMNVTVWGYKS